MYLMKQRNYNPASAASIFGFSEQLINKSLVEAVRLIDDSISPDDMHRNGRGALGNMVEEFFFGYKPNSDPRPDFPEAGVELKVTPLKQGRSRVLIKERLVIDMIDYYQVVDCPFEESLLFKKFLLMLILFYMHDENADWKDMKFLFSVLWIIKDNDLEIIKQDYNKIVSKIREGRAHELSESDTLYLAACTKGMNATELRGQPFGPDARKRAFSLKSSYMRTILDFVISSGQSLATNTNVVPQLKSLVSTEELRNNTFEDIIIKRFEPYYGMDYKLLADSLGMKISRGEKSKFGRIAKRIMLDGLDDFNDAEEIKKSGIIVKTVRIEANGSIKEHMSFENIDYKEVHECEDWEDSRWYEIVNSKLMFVTFRREDSKASEWQDETRYVLDKLVFTTFPEEVLTEAHDYWENIKTNVESDTLYDLNEGVPQRMVNTFWRLSDHQNFHVRPKGINREDRTASPITGDSVKKKCYWLDKRYVKRILQIAYGEDWEMKFQR